MPPRYRPTQIDHDRVIGIFTDELGLAYVRVYGLLGM
jgi:hypothetical protein